MTRAVLDTNTVLALWLFADPGLAHLLAAIEADTYELLTRHDALDELRCVLAYRQFGLTPARRAEIFEAYAGRCSLVASSASDAVALPNCRDPDDQKFLEIARDGGASRLITRDKVLLKLNRHRLIRPLFVIMTPEAFAATSGRTPR